MEHSEAFASQISERYSTATGIQPDIYICSAADGAAALLSETDD